MDTSVFKAHNTRAASASKANQTVRIDAVLKHIGWSTESTFRKFYQKPIVDTDSFQNAVLNVLLLSMVVSTIALKSHVNRKYVTAIW